MQSRTCVLYKLINLNEHLCQALWVKPLITDRFISQLVSTNSFHWAAGKNLWINKLLGCCCWAQCVWWLSCIQPSHCCALLQCAAAVAACSLRCQSQSRTFVASWYEWLFHLKMIRRSLCDTLRTPLNGFWTSNYQTFVGSCCLLTYFFATDW